MMDQKFLESTTRTISWLSKRDQANELVLQPTFQRNAVWSEKQKSFLIDTILRGYPVPELYMQDFTDSNGDDTYVVVDGQQRIRACLSYLADEFRLNEDDSSDFGELKFSKLSEEQRKKIYNYKFVVRTLPEMPQEELRAMFLRINRNSVSLTPQELRHATYWGEFISCCASLADNEIWSELAIFSPNNIRRMADIEFISEIVSAIVGGLQNKKDNLDTFYVTYEESFEDRALIEARFNKTLSEIGMLLPNLSKTRWRKKSDFYSLFLVLYRWSSSYPLASDIRKELGEALSGMAEEIDAFATADETNQESHTPEIRRYYRSVVQSGADLGNRKVRDTEIERVVKEVLDEETD